MKTTTRIRIAGEIADPGRRRRLLMKRLRRKSNLFVLPENRRRRSQFSKMKTTLTIPILARVTERIV
jgi:hypothetical protein